MTDATEAKTRTLAIIVVTTFFSLLLLVAVLAIATTWPAVSVGIIGAFLLLIGVVLLMLADAAPVPALVRLWPDYKDWCGMFGHSANIGAAILAIIALFLVR